MGDGSGLTAARFLDSYDDVLDDAHLVGTDLVFDRHDGTTLNAGRVLGPNGSVGATTNFYSATSAATTSIANATGTIVGGFTFLEGDSSFITLSGGNSFTIKVAGLYMINATITFASNATGRRLAYLYRAGVNIRQAEYISAQGPLTMQVEAFMGCTVNQAITVRCYQSSGAALALGASPGHRIQILKIG